MKYLRFLTLVLNKCFSSLFLSKSNDLLLKMQTMYASLFYYIHLVSIDASFVDEF